MKKMGFDNDKYLAEQSEAILERAKIFDNKLYLEFGGKLVFDYHASRILPGFDPNVKIRLLERLRNQAEIIIAVFAGDIERLFCCFVFDQLYTKQAAFTTNVSDNRMLSLHFFHSCVEQLAKVCNTLVDVLFFHNLETSKRCSTGHWVSAVA